MDTRTRMDLDGLGRTLGCILWILSGCWDGYWIDTELDTGDWKPGWYPPHTHATLITLNCFSHCEDVASRTGVEIGMDTGSGIDKDGLGWNRMS